MTTAFLVSLILTAPAPIGVKVDGEGYLRFARGGRIVYAKETQLTVQGGVLSGGKGATLLPEITVPSDAASLSVSLEGQITGKVGGKTVDLGRLVLAIFPKAATLTPNDGYLLATQKATLANPGEGLAGIIRSQGGSGASIEKPKSVKAHTGKPEIVFSPLAEVAGPKVRLGDVAEVKADAETKAKLEVLDLGDAPVAGIPRVIAPSRVLFLLQQAGFKPREIDVTIPAQAKIALKVQKITTEQFVEAAKQAITQQVGVQLPLSCNQTLPEFNAPMGELKLEAGKATKSQTGFSVLISVLVDGKKINSRLITLLADATAAGIKSGDTVRIHIRRAGASIEVSGRARTGGYVGQQITVVSSTGSVHQATVLSGSEVEVKL